MSKPFKRIETNSCISYVQLHFVGLHVGTRITGSF